MEVVREAVERNGRDFAQRVAQPERDVRLPRRLPARLQVDMDRGVEVILGVRELGRTGAC